MVQTFMKVVIVGKVKIIELDTKHGKMPFCKVLVADTDKKYKDSKNMLYEVCFYRENTLWCNDLKVGDSIFIKVENVANEYDNSTSGNHVKSIQYRVFEKPIKLERKNEIEDLSKFGGVEKC